VRIIHKSIVCPHGTSAQPSCMRVAIRHISPQSSEADTATAVADSDAADVVTAGAWLTSSTSSSSLLLLLLSTRGCRNSVWAPAEWTDSEQFYLTVSVTVEYWPERLNTFYAQKHLLLSARLSHRNSVYLSVCHTGGSVKNRCKLGSPNLYRRLPGRL